MNFIFFFSLEIFCKGLNWSVKSTKEWETLFKTISKTSYTLDICNFKNATKQFFILVFENVSIETLNLLFLISQTHSFIKLRRVDNVKINSDLESDFQIDSATCKSKLASSSLCLLLGTNTRYEGSYLNLKLRQRYYKGNFKLLSIGSFTDLTFPVSFLGSNLSTFKTFVEGNQIFCKDVAEVEVWHVGRHWDRVWVSGELRCGRVSTVHVVHTKPRLEVERDAILSPWMRKHERVAHLVFLVL